MFKKSLLASILISCTLFLTPILSLSALGQSASSAYLCDFGIALYRQGKFDEALSEFKKALLAEPDNLIAQEYMNLIFQEELGLSSPAPVRL
ncbi:MAG: tetratricopeptide repeat protein, partial [Candidatus Omnitrophota bacterium]